MKHIILALTLALSGCYATMGVVVPAQPVYVQPAPVMVVPAQPVYVAPYGYYRGHGHHRH